MKNKSFLKICALIMAAAMTLSACGSTGTSTTSTSAAKSSTVSKTESKTTETSTTEAPKEIVEINVMVYDRGHEYTNGNTVTKNEFTKWVNSQLEPQGVHVNYVPVPRSGADDKVNLMLSGGTAPDIIRTYDRQRVASYGTSGGLVDLAPYLDRLDPGYLEKAAPVLEGCQFAGCQYALPGLYSFCGKSHETFLRQDLVEGVGKEMPTNIDELIDVLYAIKAKYPDIIPYGFGGKITDGNYTNFLLAYTSRANERDNYIYEPTFTRVLKPGHKEGLKQLNRFVLDGIIDPDFALDVDNAKFDENVANGKYAFILAGSGSCIDDGYDTTGIEGYHMTEVDVLKNVDGNYDVPSQGAFDLYCYVPATAESKIDAVMTYLHFLSVEENSIEVKYGMLGYGYDMVDGVRVGRSRDDKIAAGTSTSPSDNSFLWSTFDFEKENLLNSYIAGHPSVPTDVAEQRIASRYSNFYDAQLIPDALESDTYAAGLQSLIVEFVFRCMCAPEGKFDEVYEAEYAKLVENHLEEVLNDRANWYDTHK